MADAPVIAALSPPSAVIGSPPFTLHVLGLNFTPASVIMWQGAPEPTTYVDPGHLQTGVDMSTATTPIVAMVTVVDDAGDSNAFGFTLIPEAVPIAVTWVTTADVAAALGLGPATVNGDAWLATVTAAANTFAYRRRQTAGYLDALDAAPGPAVVAGTVLYAVSLYRQRGAVDSYASFDEFGQAAMATGGTWGTVKTLLGIDRPQVG